ncbi:MAG: CPBP family intramembrane glutamic endopeptidase [Haloferacaceae archaeon]
MSTVTTDRGGIFRPAFAILSGTLVGAFGLAFGTILSVLAAFALAGVGLELTPASILVLGLLFTQGVGCIGVALTYSRLRPRVAAYLSERLSVFENARGEFRLPASVPSLRELLLVVGGYLGALGLAFAGAFVLTLFQVDAGSNQAAEIGMQNPGVLLLLIPGSFLLIGPGEELLFRGVVQGRFREVLGPVAGIGLASAIFAGIHIFALTGGSPTGNLLALGVLFFPSLVFGTAYEVTDNLVVPALIHGAYNATLFTILYVVVRFGPEIEEMAPAMF